MDRLKELSKLNERRTEWISKRPTEELSLILLTLMKAEENIPFKGLSEQLDRTWWKKLIKREVEERREQALKKALEKIMQKLSVIDKNENS